MKPLTIAQRVAVLEQELSEWKARRGHGHVKVWRQTVGIFADNPGLKELRAEAMKLRAADRRKARRRQPSQSGTIGVTLSLFSFHFLARPSCF